jgi:Fe-S-cluster-containing dehydrogenase component/DMSO reductase anchor subunit
MSIALQVEETGVVPVGWSQPAGISADLLQDQQTTAVDKFSHWRGQKSPPFQVGYYRDLIPATPPRAGEQYAFEVDLDACSGCKACVVACHHLNGLAERETWRSVGLLHGGTTALPVLQHVTTACHHCLVPACLDGCPVEAYEKDPLTGIVRHLDDRCIGCQYCILKCPYDVPKYSRDQGIVRKCDMCSDRLAHGDAPACVQACPSHAIRITTVSVHEVTENAEANLFLPGAAEPGYTLPTTVYKTKRPLPSNLLPADYYVATPQHAHWPLVLMLVLTQMSVGAFVVDQVFGLADLGGVVEQTGARLLHVGTSFMLGLIGLAASIFHLGRPWRAYRAFLGWRTSWLSREVIAFCAFAFASSAYAVVAGLRAWGFSIAAESEIALGVAVAVSGLGGVLCSAMIYASTRRVLWNPFYTGWKFFLTCIVLGVPIALLVRVVVAATADDLDIVLQGVGRWMSLALIGAAIAKLTAEAVVFASLSARTFTPLRRTALLMTGHFARVTIARFLAGVAGGLVLPGCLFLTSFGSAHVSAPLIVAEVSIALLLNLTGEILERYLFFAAVVAPKMPGAPTA